MSAAQFSMALHGGAGARRGRDYGREIDYMQGLVEAGRDRLRSGAKALDVAVETVAALEASGLYVAGRGASPNLDGRFELDACLMDGATRAAGSVAALEGFQSPIAVARAVMEATPHVMLVGEGASAFARELGFERIADPDSWFTRAGGGESNHPPDGPIRLAQGVRAQAALAHGTVGCVVRDAGGGLAAATSTGGVFGKMPGRVGDAPVIGAGTWADGAAAVSCTGQGEFFLRVAAAAQVAFRITHAGQSLEAATAAVLGEISALGGEGGMIAVDAEGAVSMPVVSEGMKRAALHLDGRIEAGAF